MAKPKEEWRHLALLISLLSLFIVTPVVAALRHPILIMNAVAAAVLVAGSYALSERKRLFAVAVALSGLQMIKESEKRRADHAIESLLLDRWSPRAMSDPRPPTAKYLPAKNRSRTNRGSLFSRFAL